jgi:hypothetical protein
MTEFVILFWVVFGFFAAQGTLQVAPSLRS